MGTAFGMTRFRAVGFLLSLSTIAGCAPPTVVYRPATDAVAARNGEPLEMRLTTGERYIIRGARVQNDTLYAVREVDEAAPAVAVVVPVNRIVSLVETERRINALGAGAVGLTAGLVAGVALIVLLLIAANTT